MFLSRCVKPFATILGDIQKTFGQAYTVLLNSLRISQCTLSTHNEKSTKEYKIAIVVKAHVITYINITVLRGITWDISIKILRKQSTMLAFKDSIYFHTYTHNMIPVCTDLTLNPFSITDMSRLVSLLLQFTKDPLVCGHTEIAPRKKEIVDIFRKQVSE